AGNSGLYARLTVVQNLEFWAGVSMVARKRRRALIERALERMALGELADRRVDRLSMGQRQRIRIAMGFLHDPTVVLLDEPHTSLGDAGVELVDAAIGALASAGGAVLWCSPAAEQLPLRADARYLLQQGKVVLR